MGTGSRKPRLGARANPNWLLHDGLSLATPPQGRVPTRSAALRRCARTRPSPASGLPQTSAIAYCVAGCQVRLRSEHRDVRPRARPVLESRNARQRKPTRRTARPCSDPLSWPSQETNGAMCVAKGCRAGCDAVLRRRHECQLVSEQPVRVGARAEARLAGACPHVHPRPFASRAVRRKTASHPAPVAVTRTSR